MSNVSRHPDANFLLDFASGGLSAAQAIAVSAHLHFCSSCRSQAESLNDIGGRLLADVEPAVLSANCQAAVFAALDSPVPVKAEIERRPAEVVRGLTRSDQLPALVRQITPVDGLRWRRLSSSLQVARLPVGEQRYELALHHIEAGGKAPAHDHRGTEITVVLQGSFSDEAGVYHQGDFMVCEPGYTHTPVATANAECVCLSVLEAPIRLVGGFKRLLNPFLSFRPA
ncbi:MAG: ChrR family anti-sigma-E factor [Pseudomonadales bacterium]|jgi:putative transcriptional regulator|nr:ChrR family anti-sigma-E factor [Pseudomonadales bacterium]MDP4766694.1 ChrR family anti-sigma-E factor [Pseudomonadales bacterium]MDP4875879.1 ChrR family anti-sigma-E factor [Pseudomonadales bacterium]